MKVADSVNARWAILVGMVVICLGLVANKSVADSTWEVTLTVGSQDPSLFPTPGSDHLDLFFGVDPSASEVLDTLDKPAPPDPPGAPYIYAYFLIGEGPEMIKLNRDMRPDEGTNIVWQGVILNTEEANSYVRWDSATLPDTGNFFFDGTVDMRTVESVNVTGTWNIAGGRYEYVFTITRSFLAQLSEIVISPDPAEVDCGGEQQFTAEGFDELGDPFATDPVWSVSSVALGTIDQTGLFTAAQIGTGWVIATDGDVVDSADVTVVVGDLAKVEVAPPQVTVMCNQEQQFTATGYDACDNEVAIDPAWSLSNSELGTIDGTGLFTADQSGTGYVIATANGYADSAQVTVEAGVVKTVAVSPESVTVLQGEQAQFTAVGFDECGNETAFAAL